MVVVVGGDLQDINPILPVRFSYFGFFNLISRVQPCQRVVLYGLYKYINIYIR